MSSELALVISPLQFSSRQIVKASPTHDDSPSSPSSSTPSNELTEKAYALIDRANIVLDGGLHRCSDWEDAKQKYFHAGALLSQAGRTNEACTSFLHAANISKAMGSSHEEITALTFAGENVDAVEPFKMDLLLTQNQLYEDQGLRLQCARTMKQAADICAASGQHEEALTFFRQAVGLYKIGKDRTSPFVKGCETQIRYHLAVLKQYKEAAEMYEVEAFSTPKGLSATQNYMMAVLCYLAAASEENFGPGVPLSKRKFSEYQDVDLALQRGRENVLLRGLIQGHDAPSLATVDETVAAFRLGEQPKERLTFDVLVAQCRDNLEALLKSYDTMP